MSSPAASPRALSPAILITAALLGIANALLWIAQADSSNLGTIWKAGEFVRAGDTFRLYNFSSYPDQPFLYLPLLAALTAPLTAVFSFEVAQFLLVLAQGFCLVLLVASAYALWFKRTMPLAWLVPTSILAWFSAAFQMGSATGHISVVALAAVTWALTATRRHAVLSGLVLGVAGSLTLTPLVLVIPLLLWSSTRLAGAWAIVGAGAAVVLSALSTGLFSVREWVGALREVLGGAVINKENQAFSAIVMGHREPLPRGVDTQVLTEVPAWLHLVPLLAALLIAAATCWVAWLNARYAQEILLIGWLCAAYLACPLLWTHSLLFLVLPIAGILAMVRPRRYQDALWTPLAIIALLLFWPLASSTSFEDDGMGVPWGGLLAALLITVLFLLAAAAPTREPGRALGESAPLSDTAEATAEEAADSLVDDAPNIREWYQQGSQRLREAWHRRTERHSHREPRAESRKEKDEEKDSARESRDADYDLD
ncbi:MULTISPECIES: glycosyltransferase family 87 protein [unclassified Corynebacterium]|uniref:glycosyltransferase family 87 protein n=1 Tax=unclassified Corynebacterium TaxID=2624378 RepID=UPI0029CA3FD7|nr:MULTISPECIES: glycosyltransferase family 87 protein [unclassified Corynebacterium]WPF65807.1 glycosyltransferase family 87 protein [Corynebacterium sp. 22KM0430]WPF68300.1 glycosyltransferase family 87 protein [Corynebacterium sp. 21KM1197]